MQIKVKDTKMHKIFYPSINGGSRSMQISVAEAKLVLIECKPEEALLWQHNGGEIILYEFGHGLIKGIGKYYKPILISETEKIEVGDWYVHNQAGSGLRILKCENSNLPIDAKKILALPEHFSPKHLQVIVEGKIKDGDKLLVECEEEQIPESIAEYPHSWTPKNFIKLNSFNYITLHKIEEKMYTRATLINFALYLQDTCEILNGDFYHNNQLVIMDKYFDEWLTKQK